MFLNMESSARRRRSRSAAVTHTLHNVLCTQRRRGDCDRSRARTSYNIVSHPPWVLVWTRWISSQLVFVARMKWWHAKTETGVRDGRRRWYKNLFPESDPFDIVTFITRSKRYPYHVAPIVQKHSNNLTQTHWRKIYLWPKFKVQSSEKLSNLLENADGTKIHIIRVHTFNNARTTSVFLFLLLTCVVHF